MTGTIYLIIISLAVWQTSVGDYNDLREFLKQQANNKTFVRLYEKHLQYFRDDSKNFKAGATFSCQKLPTPKSPPTSVHQLTPMDVKVIAAIGDSMTAGTGIVANTVVGELIEARGLAWSIGGDETISSVDTLANILKVYNPDVTGYSTGWGPVWWEASSHLNVADPGAKSKDMPGQAELLVRRMKNTDNLDYENDWKIITIFIGGNDLCDFCEDKEQYGADSYRANLQEALDYLHANIPKAFVNLVQIIPMAPLKELNENLICDVMHYFGCRCAAYPKNSEAEAELKAETQKYRDVLEELIDTGRYDTREDFTVVLQPFFENTYPPKKPGSGEPDLSYFAPDCFHLSLKGHRAASDALWNNMVEPFGKKRTEWFPGEQIECPTQKEVYTNVGGMEYSYHGSSICAGDNPIAKPCRLSPPTGEQTVVYMSHPYFYTYKNSQGSLGANAEISVMQDDGETEDFAFGAAQQDTNTETQSDKPSGDQSDTIATATILTITMVVGVALIVAGVVAWRRARLDYETLPGPSFSSSTKL